MIFTYYDSDEEYPLADELVEAFESFLKSKGIMFINEDTDDFQLKHKHSIYGGDFRNIRDNIQVILDKHM